VVRKSSSPLVSAGCSTYGRLKLASIGEKIQSALELTSTDQQRPILIKQAPRGDKLLCS
jgi:hypothetical protein